MKLKQLVLSCGVAAALAFSASTAFAKCGTGGAKVVAHTIEKGTTLDFAINKSLTGKAGDVKNGLATIVNRKEGNCIACHKVSAISALADPNDLNAMKKYAFHGETGPSLDGLASRYSEGEIRMLMVDVKKIFPDSLMPSFHVDKGHGRKDGYLRPKKGCEGKAVISAEKVEDIVAYLKTLK